MNPDWDAVTVIRKNKPTSKDLKSNEVLNRAMATGNVEVTRKCTIIAMSAVLMLLHKLTLVRIDILRQT